MRGSSGYFVLFLIAFILIIDIYAFRGIRLLLREYTLRTRIATNIIYWMIPATVFICIVFISIYREVIFTKNLFKVFYFLIGFFVLFYVPKFVFIVFQAANDLVRFTGILLSKFGAPESRMAITAHTMSRAKFLTQVGIALAAIPFLSVIYGITRGRFNYKVKKVKLTFDNLPDDFDGLKIIQISDWHIGSFITFQNKVNEAVELINSLKADIILFTGDIVNNTAEEIKEFVPILKKLHAKHGVYSVLGNHDYGEYKQWKNKGEHLQNMEDLFKYQKEAGFKLLRNESLTIKKNNAEIGIAGLENWGLPPFPQYGNLSQALKNIKTVPFKIIMSHDPSHWDAEILKQSDADLTLSGHTHGMQFGINIPGFKWSPVKWKYPRWSGLYKEGRQYLYVNVGIGYVAFPGRVGFFPEITAFELKTGLS